MTNGTVKGRISNKEFEAYGGTEISMMNLGNNTISSGTMGGEGYWEWTLSWNADGFIGQGWTSDGINFYNDIMNGTFDKDKYGPSIAGKTNLIYYGCSTYELSSQPN